MLEDTFGLRDDIWKENKMQNEGKNKNLPPLGQCLSIIGR